MSNQHILRPVIRAFMCKVKGNHFAVGDTYTSDDPERIAFLESEGFIGPESAVEESADSDLPTLEAFTELKADAQKELLARLEIEGDVSNEEKRIALYTAFLQSRSSDE